MFDEENAKRRKSSLVSSENPKLAEQIARKKVTTSCFVHQLLEKTRSRRGQPALSYNEDRNLDKASEPRDQNVHSRLLTKRQLSEMAIGVRELSKKLGSLRLRLKVKSIFLLTKAHDSDLIALTRNVSEWLLSKQRDTEYTVFVARSLERFFGSLLWKGTLKTLWSTIEISTRKALCHKIPLSPAG